MQSVKNAGYKPIRVMFYYLIEHKRNESKKRWKHYTQVLMENTITAMTLGTTSRNLPKLI